MFKTNDGIAFYSPTNFSRYGLKETMGYQLRILDSLDVLTKKHSENVANVVSRMCEYLNCKTEYILYTTMCAYLHDIGKIFIPKEILFKDDVLTDEEYETIKKHTIYGYNMCMKDPKLKIFAEGPLYHHECLDGSGYPNGIKSKDIPFSSQIIHVADVYDALVTKRHYTTHVNISATLKDLIRESEPSTNELAFDQLSTSQKEGKISKKALNALFKVVIDDTKYEIYSTKQYINSLKDEYNRLKQIVEFGEKAQKNPKKKEYFENGMKLLFTDGETFDNYLDVFNDYKDAIDKKNKQIERLNLEVKILTKLKA